MQLLAVIAIVMLLALVWAATTLAHLMAEHPLITVLAGLTVPAAITALIAIGKGMNKKTVRSWPRELPPAPSRPRLPAPVDDSLRQTVPLMSHQPFVAEEDPAFVLHAEPEQKTCDGPGCGKPLPEDFWTIDVEPEDPDEEKEVRSFCSGECAEQWQDADEKQREQAC